MPDSSTEPTITDEDLSGPVGWVYQGQLPGAGAIGWTPPLHNVEDWMPLNPPMVDRLRAALRAERQRVTALTVMHGSVVDALTLATARIDALRDELSVSNEALRIGAEECKALRQQVADLTARLESSQRMREVARQRNEKLEKELALLRKGVL